MQLSECKEQLEESHRQHEQMVRAMKQDLSPKNRDSDITSPMKLESLQNELARMQEENSDHVKELK